MKNMITINRIGLCLNAGLLTLTLSVLAVTAAFRPTADQGKIIYPSLKTRATHALGHGGGMRCDWWWWLRRMP